MGHKSLYDDDERYTPEAVELDSKIHSDMRKYFLEYISKGFSVRQISAIAVWAIKDIELVCLLYPGK